ncbi:MAG: EAL domain-containing protein [Gammaproteobacteria bacterium]|nr:EAL domain-containing protein [Gammaproteobacteria bacterium]
MTLARQLMILIVVLVGVLFVGTLAISVQNARAYLDSQLASHAQDAATSLGLSATAHVDSGDQAMVTAMVNAMFHRGDYLLIRFEDLQGAPWLERSVELRLDDVPAWFQRVFTLQPPRRSATMMAGWRQVGRVVVVSHPGLAYRQLWQTAEQMLHLFAIAALLAILVGMLGLRVLLRPLRDVEAQAAAICRREFPVVRKRPLTLELRRVVEAMNGLSARVSRMLDDAETLAAELRRQAYQDPVTGLANRRQFMDVLDHRVADRELLAGGGLLLLQLRDFKAYNQAHGYPAGDRLLAETARALSDALTALPAATPAHLSGADFAVLVENVDAPRLQRLAEDVAAAVAALYGRLGLPSPDVAHVGGSVFCGMDASSWLADADVALREAQRSGANSVVVRQCDAADRAVRSGSAWRKLIEQALGRGDLRLLRQPVLGCADAALLHHEVFVRIPDPDAPGQDIAAAVLLPMAENAGLAADVDRAVIERVVAGIADGDFASSVAVNISPASLAAAGLLDWLVDYLAAQRDAARRLVLELPEYGAALQLDRLADWTGRLRPLGVEFALDHFGRGFSSFAYLRTARLDYLKVDGSFVRDLHRHDDNRFFLRTIADIAHSLDMRVIAESVESEEDWQALQRLGIDGGRGFWLGRPA